MTAPRVVTGLFLLLVPAIAADPALPKFGGERIGVPPLSLAESVAKGAGPLSKSPFSTKLIEGSTPRDLPPPLSPKLVPRSSPLMPHLAERRSRSPRVNRDSGMPVIIPSEAVEYAMKIIPPDPNVDFKLVIKDPSKGRVPASPAKKQDR